jgi:hypothetical protein
MNQSKIEKMSDFFEGFNDPLMQAFNFTYKDIKYQVYGWWGIAIIDDNDNAIDIDDDSLVTKEDVLNARVFDNNTKNLKDIIPEIKDLEFDF